MYFTEFLRVLLRRWYVVVAGIIALGIAGAMVVRYVPTQYQAAGQVLLKLPVQATGRTTPTNPFLNLQSGLSTTASIVANTVGSKDTQRRLTEEGHDAEYSAEVLPGAGPIIVVTAKDDDPANALGTRDAVMALIGTRLASLQENLQIPETQVISALQTNVDERAEVVPGAKIKAMVAIGAGIAVLTLVLAFVIDGWARNRPRRRRRGGSGADGEPDGPTDLDRGERRSRDDGERGEDPRRGIHAARTATTGARPLSEVVGHAPTRVPVLADLGAADEQAPQGATGDTSGDLAGDLAGDPADEPVAATDEVAARRRFSVVRMRGGSLSPVAVPDRGLL